MKENNLELSLIETIGCSNLTQIDVNVTDISFDDILENIPVLRRLIKAKKNEFIDNNKQSATKLYLTIVKFSFHNF